jgi:hypothetical protein
MRGDLADLTAFATPTSVLVSKLVGSTKRLDIESRQQVSRDIDLTETGRISDSGH